MRFNKQKGMFTIKVSSAMWPDDDREFDIDSIREAEGLMNTIRADHGIVKDRSGRVVERLTRDRSTAVAV